MQQLVPEISIFQYTLNITACFGLQGTIIRESNHIGHFYTTNMMYKSQVVKM